MAHKNYKKQNHDIAIHLVNVGKKYEIHHEKPTLVEKFFKGRNEVFWALKDINLTIRKGEKIGIIGLNGSGKTTLLKIISGITTPTNGKVHTYGKVVSLIDLEAGFHLDLSGVQNIFLNGLLLGMERKEIEHKLGDIIAFADIKQFIDVPLYTYSNGMIFRLAFSVAVYSDPEILIIDENFLVGDKEFQSKTKEKIKELFTGGKTVIVASHWLSFIRENCTRIVNLTAGILEEKVTPHKTKARKK